jgi:hypothetical protein
MARGLLLERERELAELDGLTEALVGDRQGGAAVLQGAPGLGKSALMAAAAATARQHGAITVLEFCCGEYRKLDIQRRAQLAQALQG